MTKAKCGDTVKVHFTGRLENNEVFDTLRKTSFLTISPLLLENNSRFGRRIATLSRSPLLIWMTILSPSMEITR